MKFVGQVMDSVTGIEWYAIVGILIFVTLFIVILIRTIRMPKNEVDEIKKGILPDDDEDKEDLDKN